MVESRPSATQSPAAQSGWRLWATAALDLLFPPLCPLCQQRLGEARRDPLCGACWERLPRVTPPFCLCCGRPFGAFQAGELPSRAAEACSVVSTPSGGPGPGRCEPCRRESPPFSYARAAGLYRETMREALHAFKFAGKANLAGPLGDLLAEAGAALLPREEVDCLVPVPLHPAREAERGFNQSLLLARRVSRRWGIPVADGVLRRVRVTRPQTDLSAPERRANVRGAFALLHVEAVAGAHALLVDDILTTGATVSECARVLGSEGRARAVGVLTVACVP